MLGGSQRKNVLCCSLFAASELLGKSAGGQSSLASVRPERLWFGEVPAAASVKKQDCSNVASLRLLRSGLLFGSQLIPVLKEKKINIYGKAEKEKKRDGDK